MAGNEIPFTVVFKISSNEEKKIQNIFSKALSGLSGGSGGGIKGAAVGGAVAGGAIVALTTIAKGINIIASNIVNSSTALQGVFKMFEYALMIFFKPFGDFLGSLLRPLAILLIKFALDAGKWFKTFFENMTLALQGLGVADLIDKIEALIGGEGEVGSDGGLPGVAGDGAGESTNDPVVGIIDTFNTWIDSMIENLLKSIPIIQEKFGKVISFIGDVIVPIILGVIFLFAAVVAFNFALIIGVLAGLFVILVSFLEGVWTILMGIIELDFEKIIEGLTIIGQGIIDGFTIMWDFISAGFDLWFGVVNNMLLAVGINLEKFSKDVITFTTTLITWFLVTLPEILVTEGAKVATALSNFIQGVKDWIDDQLSRLTGGLVGGGDDSGHQVGMAYVPEDGVYKLHRGESVISGTQEGASGSSMDVTNNIIVNATINNDFDIDDLASELAKRTQDSLRRRMSYGW